MNEAEGVPDIAEVVDALNKATGGRVTNFHYESWLRGAPPITADAFDMLVLDFIGLEAHHKMNGLARLDAYLRWKLGLGPDNAGGIHFKELAYKTIGEYIDNNSSLKLYWDSKHLKGFRDCPIENEPGVDAKRIVDAAEAFIEACKPIKPLWSGEIDNFNGMVQEQLEVIWCG